MQTTNLPVAYITSDKNRKKVYNSKNVYLKDGENFEIEIYNPTSKKIHVELKINGCPIADKLYTVYPEQRVYVDTYYTTEGTPKFKFVTYQVSNKQSSIENVKLNGNIEINFFEDEKFNEVHDNIDEIKKWIELLIRERDKGQIVIKEYYPYYPWWRGTYYPVYPNYPSYPHFPVWYSTDVHGINNCGGYYNLNSSFGTNQVYNNDKSFLPADWMSKNMPNVDSVLTTSSYSTDCNFNGATGKININDVPQQPVSKEFKNEVETGIVDKGEFMNKVILNTVEKNNKLSFHTISYQLLPESRMEVTNQTIRKNCSCGKKLKPKDKFCSRCGKPVE